MPCKIINMSHIGALLEVEHCKWIPYAFKLLVEGESACRYCEVKHRLPHGIGVCFVSSFEASRYAAELPTTTTVDAWCGRQRSSLAKARCRGDAR